jgi:hypothetical protein
VISFSALRTDLGTGNAYRRSFCIHGVDDILVEKHAYTMLSVSGKYYEKKYIMRKTGRNVCVCVCVCVSRDEGGYFN